MIATKRRKTQTKVASFIKLNEQIISKYGSFNALRSQRTLFSRDRLEEYREASYDYRNYLRRKKFIENNFEVTQVPLSSSSSNRIDESIRPQLIRHQSIRHQQDREDENNREDEEDNDDENERIEQSDSNDVLLDETRKLRDENTKNMYCSNCRRRQCNDLIERYGEMYRLVFYRYVILI